MRGRSQEAADFSCWGARPGMETYMAVNCRKEIAARFSDFCWKMRLAMEFQMLREDQTNRRMYFRGKTQNRRGKLWVWSQHCTPLLALLPSQSFMGLQRHLVVNTTSYKTVSLVSLRETRTGQTRLDPSKPLGQFLSIYCLHLIDFRCSNS